MADPFCASEGVGDDERYFQDKTLFQMLNASESVKMFEDIDSKLLLVIKEYSGHSLNRDRRYAVYKFLVDLFKTGVRHTQFKRRTTHRSRGLW